jgi:hypothetical protein
MEKRTQHIREIKRDMALSTPGLGVGKLNLSFVRNAG